jgi:hypothetical protein
LSKERVFMGVVCSGLQRVDWVPRDGPRFEAICCGLPSRIVASEARIDGMNVKGNLGWL